MGKWKEYKLSEVAVLNKSSISKNFPHSFIQYIDTSAVTENKFEQPEIYELSQAPSRAKRLVQYGDTIISTVRPVQKHFGYIRDEIANRVVSTGFAVVTPISIDPKFLYYYLTQEEVTIYLNTIAESSTTTFPAFRSDELLQLVINAPENLEEQAAIAEILSSLDDKIELNNKINGELEALAQALFKQWFVDFEFPNEKGQPYKSSGGKMVESELGEIPEGWRVAQFNQHIEATRGLSYKGGGLTTAGDGVPMVNLNSVYEGGGYKYEGIKYYSGDYKERHIIKPWDLAVTNTEQGHKYLLIGYPAFVSKSIGEFGIFSHHIYRVVAKPQSELSNQYFYYLMLQPFIREQIIGACNGTTVNMLKIDGLERPFFILPPSPLVKKFTTIVTLIWEKKETIYTETQDLVNLRNTLLPRLISGELEISELELAQATP